MNISIIGAGWLGLPLAQHLQKKHKIVASKTSTQGMQNLLQQGIEAVRYKLADNLQQPVLEPLFNADCLVLNIAPGRRNQNLSDFTEQMLRLLQRAQSVQHLLFVSTTSVYGQQSGYLDENSPTAPQTTSAKAHWQLEQAVLALFAERASVLRLSGLVSEDRHPARSMAGSKRKGGGEAVNLIHRNDVIRAIQRIIEHQHWGKTFHLAAVEHPTRADYYCWACDKLGLPSPTFEQSQGEAKGKMIDASQTLAQLGLTLEYASPYQMLQLTH